MTVKAHERKGKIHSAERATDTLTSRGGLCLFVRYFHGIQLFPNLERLFGGIGKNAKGQAAESSSSSFAFLYLRSLAIIT
jgi:hypothetical protein